jgi:hypothetical protein
MDYEGNGAHFEVYCAGVVAAAIKEVHRQAVKAGCGEEMVAAFQQAIERLRTAPNEFGEILYRLPVMRMKIGTAVIRPIAIDFAVCTDRPIVFIKGVTLLSQ